MKLKQLALACALTGSLAACGGGGSDAGVQKDRTLSGVASKGLIKNGVVKVYSYSADGTRSANPVATTKTDMEGSYSVKIGSTIGLFTVEVSASTDASTTMSDEFSGDIISMPIDMTLRSVFNLDNADSTTVKSYVTPLTDMLVKSAESASGGLTSNNFDDARRGVTKMLGFNPLETKPINVDDSKAVADMDAAEQKQSLYLAAFSKLANDATNNLECTGTVSVKIACVVKATSESATIKDGILSLTPAVQNEIITARDAVISDSSLNKTKIISPDGQADLSPVTVPTSAVVNSITAAKALFASLRSNINVWSAAAKTGGSLNNQAEALKADFDTAIAPLDKDLADWILISGRGIELFNKFKDGSITENSVPVFGSDEQSYYDPNTQQYGYYQQPIGFCSVYADAAADTTLATTPTEAKSVFCSLIHTYVSSTWDQVTGEGTETGFTKTILLVPGAGSTPSFSYESRARMETWKYSSSTGVSTRVSKDTIGSYGSTDRAKGTVSYTMSGDVVTRATINGFMPARTDDMGVAITDQESWNVSFVRTPEAGGVYKYALSGDITALKSGVSVGSVALENGSYIRTVSPVGNYEVNNEVNLVLSVAAVKSKVTGTLSLSKFSADKHGSNYIPTDLKFSGSFSNANSEFFKGTLTAKTTNYAAYDNSLPRSTTNFSPTSGSFVGILRIPARPDLKLTLSANNSALDVANFSAQYDDGTNTVLIDSTNAKPKVINISSASGVSMQLNDGVDMVDVMRNSSKIAVLNTNTGMIDYADGSGESLK